MAPSGLSILVLGVIMKLTPTMLFSPNSFLIVLTMVDCDSFWGRLLTNKVVLMRNSDRLLVS